MSFKLHSGLLNLTPDYLIKNMTIKTLSAAIAFVALISCTSNSSKNVPGNETPQALTNTTTSYDITKKRGYEDLVESLYSELVAKDPKLKNIEGAIDTLHISQGDSTHTFFEFDQMNQAYFNSANHHIAKLKDSTLRKRLTMLIANNLSAYNSKITKHTKLLKAIDTNDSKINDLHLVLKIVTTLPVIRKYQDGNLPDTAPLTGFVERQNRAIKLVDTLIKK